MPQTDACGSLTLCATHTTCRNAVVFLQVHLDRWEYHRVISLHFDEPLKALNPLHATIEPQDGYFESGSELRFKLQLQEGARPCSSGHLDDLGNPERDTECDEAHPENSPQIFSFQMMPPTKEVPRISCEKPGAPTDQERYPETPPSPLPLSPPPPVERPPPPKPPTVQSDAACELGGKATVLYALHKETYDLLRVLVQPSEIRDGYQFTVGFVGLEVTVSHLVGHLCSHHPVCHVHLHTNPAFLVLQTQASLSSDSASETSHIARSFIFVPKPGASSFSFNVRGSNVLLTFLSCRRSFTQMHTADPHTLSVLLACAVVSNMR